MRVIAGEAKGRRLHAPGGRRVRPSAARFRESAFGILAHRHAIEGARVLDLFAGTGALGIEALSRGAASLVAVEQSRHAAQALRDNLAACGFADRAEVLVQEIDAALGRLARQERRFDLVLIDPPYHSGLVEPTLRAIVAHCLTEPGGRVLVEHARDEAVGATTPFESELMRNYGTTALTLLHRSAAETSSGIAGGTLDETESGTRLGPLDETEDWTDGE